MAIYLFKLIRRKYREQQAQKAIPTSDDAHLVPEVTPGLGHQSPVQPHDSSIQPGLTSATPHNHADSVSDEEIAQQKAEARRRKIRQLKLILGLTLPNFLAAMDVTIVAPAIPLISSHFSMSFYFRTEMSHLS